MKPEHVRNHSHDLETYQIDYRELSSILADVNNLLAKIETVRLYQNDATVRECLLEAHTKIVRLRHDTSNFGLRVLDNIITDLAKD